MGELIELRPSNPAAERRWRTYKKLANRPMVAWAEAVNLADELHAGAHSPAQLREGLRQLERITFRSDLDNFYYDYVRRVLRDGELVREKTWDDVIPRDHQ